MSVSGTVDEIYRARRDARAELDVVLDRLTREFDGQLPAGSVLTFVIRCRERLIAQGVRAGLATATEAMARAELLGMLRAEPAARTRSARP